MHGQYSVNVSFFIVDAIIDVFVKIVPKIKSRHNITNENHNSVLSNGLE